MVILPMIFSHRAAAAVTVAFCIAMGLAGCNNGPPTPKTYPVSGEVTLDGKPMKSGEVTFVSVADGIRDSVQVVDGKFAGEVMAGNRQIEIRSYVPVKVNNAMYASSDVNGEPSMENIIPAKYNTNTTMTETVKEGENAPFKFEVTSH